MTKIYLGCSGWQYKEWRKSFYPESIATKEYLWHYCKHFNSLELDNIFYRLPSETTVKRWYDTAPKNFKYSIKASRYITHVKRFHDVGESMKLLYGIADTLAEKTGCFLFQLPSNLHFTPENLERLLKQLDNNYKNVLEFRHPSWWAQSLSKTLETSNVGFCTVSGFNVPDDLMIINNKAYIRLHGNDTYSASYSTESLSIWANIIKTANLDEVWIYFNNTANGYAPQNALELSHLLLGGDNLHHTG